eukprot:TRINITY_DN74189_c0_g1_i1.p1 TRINITY_DN74189_c0_g1~~TRINITY_DN74189_c0_g1_i1.p1  ORF type:complete len:503 (-),score=75.92 TRINITY_DN74189_c0_g1_i1:128-1579(-)
MPKAVFVFPSASGHVNPSLPLARGLVSLGWAVEYLCKEQFKEAIEDTGATFFDVCRDLGMGDVTAMIVGSVAEYNDASAAQWAINFGSIASHRLLPAYISWFRSREPQLVVYCPVLCSVAHFAASHLRIPDVSLLTAAGPGFWDAAFAAIPGASAEMLAATIKANTANAAAVDGIRAVMSDPNLTLNTALPLVSDYYTGVNLVTTLSDLADDLNATDAEFYRAVGKEFIFVGPLLDKAGAKRATAASGTEVDHAPLMAAVEAASAAGRKVVYVSMGTVITGDDKDHGWNAMDGTSLTGKELCQAVYRAVFEELGAKQEVGDPSSDGIALIVVSLGPQPDALDGIAVPSNVVSAASVPQVDLLRKAKPALFITNGGQNSLMESMSVGTPVVVCPGFGDQVANGTKAQGQGWGLCVKRPMPLKGESGVEVATGATFQASVQSAVQEVLGGGQFTARARHIAASMERAEGVEGTLRILCAQAAPKE